MVDWHISLLSIAIAALINLWLATRCGKVRISDKVLHGDGGNALLAKRMRAQANFIEYTPIALLLILVLDINGQHGWLLAITALVFMAGRIMHAFGMDADHPAKSRQFGIMMTFIPMLIWIIWAALVAFGVV